MLQKTGLTVTIPFGVITSVVKKTLFDDAVLRINLTSQPPYLHSHYEVRFSEVEEPVAPSADDLRLRILSMNLGWGSPEEFVAIAGQTEFVTEFEYKTPAVFVDELLKSKDTYSYDVATKTLEFSDPMLGGETISIINL